MNILIYLYNKGKIRVLNISSLADHLPVEGRNPSDEGAQEGKRVHEVQVKGAGVALAQQEVLAAFEVCVLEDEVFYGGHWGSAVEV